MDGGVRKAPGITPGITREHMRIVRFAGGIDAQRRPLECSVPMGSTGGSGSGWCVASTLPSVSTCLEGFRERGAA